jgi:hypothetical protein
MVPLDKQLHFLAGGFIAALAFPFGLVVAALLSSSAAIGKEIWDYYGNGTPDVWDAVATLIGAVVMLAWLLLFN